jgi:hypothetical protein
MKIRSIRRFTSSGATCALSALLVLLAGCSNDDGGGGKGNPLRVGVAAIPITPCGDNPEWDGPVTPNGVWGEQFNDLNGNGLWDSDSAERPVDDPLSSTLDPSARNRYNGIFLAGFGSDRLATGCHDDIWARAVVIEDGHHKIAMVSVDLIGYVYYGRYYGFSKAQEQVDPALGIDTFLYSSTHQHEGPDALGLWGFFEFADGKFPRYLQFVDRQVARAINAAAAPEALQEVSATIAATTDPTLEPRLRGMQVRTGCRPPWFFDQELRALQFVGDDGTALATLINWGTHPESLEDQNTEVSSDFVHYIRQRVEDEFGGTAVYFTGALGAAEIVGDTCVGGADPHNDDGSNPFDRRDDLGHERTAEIGNLVGDAVVDMLRAAEPIDAAALDVQTSQYYVAGSNEALSFANLQGILDLDMDRFNVANCPPDTGICAPVTQHQIALNDDSGAPLVQIATAPGEIFPELFYGVEAHKRTDCPAADTGLPYEPSIRDGMIAPHRWLIGLSPDEFGYIVPGYDFYPSTPAEELDDVCAGMAYDPNVPRRRVPSHYHESLSIGADAAATTTCYALQMLGETETVSANAACQRVLSAGD